VRRTEARQEPDDKKDRRLLRRRSNLRTRKRLMIQDDKFRHYGLMSVAVALAGAYR
jgi:hypothetical protein